MASHIIKIILTALASIMVLATAFAKFVKAKPVVEALTKAGVIQHINALAIAELISLAFWLYPKTSNIGFFLLCCFFGGAIATEIKQPPSMLGPSLILTLIWIATYFRNPSLFLGSN